MSEDENDIKKETMVKVDIGISENNRREMCKRLARLQANEYLLYTKTLKFHWNVVDRQFHDLHEFFKDIYEKLFIVVDDVAERIRTLGGTALGTMTEFLKYTTLREYPGSNPSAPEMLAELLSDFETIIKELRDDAEYSIEHDDAGTNNFLTEKLMQQEKTAWMLRSHLQSRK